jgi:hypothetical protein
VTAPASILTPFQLTATAGLLQNQGIAPNAVFESAVASYVSTPLIQPLANAVSVGSTGNILSANVLSELVSFAANTCPALGDSIPGANIAPSTTAWPSDLMSTLLTNTANTYTGNGDVTKFIQAFSVASGYANITNQFINSTVNSNNYLCNTFTNSDNMFTGDITAVNKCTAQWATDLNNLGSLINLANLGELGSPIALIKQLAKLGGLLPQITTAFAGAGVSTDVIVNLSNPNIAPSLADQKAMYNAMTQITGDTLLQILQIFGIKNNYYTGSVVGPVSAYVNQQVSVYITGGVPNTAFSWHADPSDPPTNPSGGFTFDATGAFTYTFTEPTPGTYTWQYQFVATGQTGNYTLVFLPEGTEPAPPPAPDRPARLPGTLPVNITTMADLLNPYKLFPNSFQTLTVTDVSLVSQNIYINATGTVNATLAQTLPNIVLHTLS